MKEEKNPLLTAASNRSRNRTRKPSPRWLSIDNWRWATARAVYVRTGKRLRSITIQFKSAVLYAFPHATTIEKN